ncbi:MAG: lipase family protein [Myxococcota bacterium]
MRTRTRRLDAAARLQPLGLSLTKMLLVLSLVVVGCGGSDLPQTPDDSFYIPPDPLPSATPGTLIRSQEVAPIAAASRTFAVLYVSESLPGDPIAVSGLVVVPNIPEPAEGLDVVSWGHGTKGLADRCAPSRGFSGPTHDFFLIAPELIDAGYLAVSSDYEGLGTPELHPYLVGESQARSALDIVRAATQLEQVQGIDQVAVWGRSQGGQTALFASEIAASWAPELDLAAVVAAAPACCMETVAKAGALIPGSRGLVWMSLVAYAEAFELDFDAVFTDDGRTAVDALIADDVCYEEWVEVANSFGDDTGIAINFDRADGWIDAFERSSPGRVAVDVPVLVLQGTADTTTPKALTDILTTDMCMLGTSVDYRVFEGFSHNDSTAMNMPLMLEWTAARFAGEPAGITCE